MALVYVGGTSGTGSGAASYTVSLTGLTGGIASAPAAGDIVVVFHSFAHTASVAPTVSGDNSGSYTPATAAQHVNDTWDTEFRSFYFVQGATPDTSLTVNRINNTTYGAATVVQVWRGVDAANPFIGAATPASGANGAALNPPAYNPAVADSIIIAGGAGTMPSAGTAGYTGITGMSNTVTAYGNGSTADISAIMASYAYAGASYDPPIATGGTQNNTSSSWAGVTLAIRPEPPVITGTGAATETGADTAASSGAVIIAGDAAPAESGADVASASGVVQDAAIAGTGAVTEAGADNASASGQVFIAGAAAAPEAGADAGAASGQILVSGSGTATGATDSAAGAGAVLVNGTAATSEAGQDVGASTGSVSVQGTAAIAETGEDAGNASGAVLVQASAAIAELGQDSASATGGVESQPVIVGTSSIVEAGGDSAAAGGKVQISGAANATDTASDSASAAGRVIVLGYAAPIEIGNDSASASGGAFTPTATGSGAAIEFGADALAALGQVLIFGQVNASESVDDLAFATNSGIIIPPLNSFAVPTKKNAQSSSNRTFTIKPLQSEQVPENRLMTRG